MPQPNVSHEKKLPGAVLFPIVAVGASAGGLEPLEQFIGGCGPIGQCAFVVIQHLSAKQPSLLGELLQRHTAMSVRAIEGGDRPLPGHVHVIAPGCEIRLKNGAFEVFPVARDARAHLPIDTFFESMAQDVGDRAVGVILSGMGSDGTAGLRAIKHHCGGAFVQTAESAQFDSMPQSAIQAGVADTLAEPADLPAHIAAYLAPSDGENVFRGEQGGNERAIDAILETLHVRTGHDFSRYKKSTVQRRIERRMALHQRVSYAGYAELLGANAGEADLLFKELLIGVTSFFRDPQVWLQLEQDLLPQVLARHKPETDVRIWVAACSTGEEAYTLAMLLIEAMQELPRAERPAIKIFATDLDKDAIARARSARYPASIAADITPQRLARFFHQDQHGYQVCKQVRDCVIFALHNVATDPPFTKLSMLVCRNLMIYFEPELQRALLPLFHYSLEPGGLLMLGTAETVGTSSEYFDAVAGKSKMYRRLESFRRSGFIAFSAALRRPHATKKTMTDSAPDTRDLSPPNLQSVADHLLLQRYAPAAVLVTNEGDVLYISGKTGRYLEPAAGKANWNVLAMAREGLRALLSNALRDALRSQRAVVFQGVVVDAHLGSLPVRVTVDPLVSPSALSGMVMVVFAEGEAQGHAPFDAASDRSAATPAREELAQIYDALHAARQDAQSAEEQSHAANEELQSTNEELQSTNEELMTSKEEMQSMNEELQTVNQELQAKVAELSQASDDMRNLLNSTDIATLFLDEALRIRRFTPQATSLFKLIDSDVGRPITDIRNELVAWALADDAKLVLDSLVFRERDVEASDQRWFKVRTMPYRTFQNQIYGVVITFSDITRAKQLELQLQSAKHTLEDRLADGDADSQRGAEAPGAD